MLLAPISTISLVFYALLIVRNVLITAYAPNLQMVTTSSHSQTTPTPEGFSLVFGPVPPALTTKSTA